MEMAAQLSRFRAPGRRQRVRAAQVVLGYHPRGWQPSQRGSPDLRAAYPRRAARSARRPHAACAPRSPRSSPRCRSTASRPRRAWPGASARARPSPVQLHTTRGCRPRLRMASSPADTAGCPQRPGTASPTRSAPAPRGSRQAHTSMSPASRTAAPARRGRSRHPCAASSPHPRRRRRGPAAAPPSSPSPCSAADLPRSPGPAGYSWKTAT